ncbi:hypothetical protein RCO48_30465 [Peribacillus frigoritolerans]|nr:hypothetical protein [Peribacillus frigoritolerans]
MKSLIATMRSPFTERNRSFALYTYNKGSMSPAGEALQILPPNVPRFLIAGAAIVLIAFFKAKGINGFSSNSL